MKPLACRAVKKAMPSGVVPSGIGKMWKSAISATETVQLA